MKPSFPCLLLVLGLFGSQAVPAATNSILVDFNSPGELTGLFNDGYATPSWSQNSSGGLGGNGGITIPAGSFDLYISKQGFLMQTGATYTVGAYFYNEDNDGYGGLGFSTLTSGTMNGGYATPLSAIGVSFHGGGGYFDNNTATITSSNSVTWKTSLQTVSSNWFYFQDTLVVTGTNTFNQTFQIWLCDTNGNFETNFTTTSISNQVNATLSAATIIYPFFGASSNRFIAADNFTAMSTVAPVPFVVAQSASQTVAVGGTMNLSVTAAGPAPLTYQWLKNGTIIEGATNSTLSTPNAGITNSGSYYAAVGNSNGVAISEPVLVTVGAPQLFAWGLNSYGQLGNGTGTTQLTPEPVATNDVVAAAGASHSLFVKSDGTLWAMGYNLDGELGDGTTTSRNLPECVASNVVAVAAGQGHSLFLAGNGTLWGTGANSDGQLGDGTTTSRSTPETVASNVVAVAAGQYFSLFLKNDGTLWAMGYNYDGELGDGTTTYRHSPVAVIGGTNVIAIGTGAGHSLFVRNDGTLWGIGYNNDGELGIGNVGNQSLPVAVTGGTNASAARGGSNHTIFFKGDGTVWTMGNNNSGQLGNGGSGDDQFDPVFVASNAVAVAAGGNFSMFIATSGTLWTMGNNFNGQLGDGTQTQRNSPVPISGLSLAGAFSGSQAQHTLGIGASIPTTIITQPASQTVIIGSNVTFSITASGLGTLGYQWQFNGANLVGATLTNFSITNASKASAGDYTVVVSNYLGSVTSAVAVLSVISTPTITAQPGSQALAMGGTLNLSVAALGAPPMTCQWFQNGRLVPGATNDELTVANAGLTNSGVYYAVMANAYGLGISLPVTVAVGAPQLLAWGNNQYGQLGDGTINQKNRPESVATNVVTAAAGQDHSLFVESDGTLWAMGENGNGQLGDGTTNNHTLPEFIASNAVSVAAGANHSLFLTADGTLWAMGNNGSGQLGNATVNEQTNPIPVCTNVAAISAGFIHSLFLKCDGSLWAMGYNGYGQLGDGTYNQRNNPVSVASNVVAVAAGADHSLFLKCDGSLWAMGYNGDGELGDGTTTARPRPVPVIGGTNVIGAAGGAWHSLFLTDNGTLNAVGQDYFGELDDGGTTSQTQTESVATNTAAMTAGYDDSLFLDGNGILWAVGDNSYGELGDGTAISRMNAVTVPCVSLANVISGPAAYHTLAVGMLLPPAIISQPASQTVGAGSNVTFTVAASGISPLTYQWQFNGTNLAGATATNYSLIGVTSANAGNYTVVVTDTYGSTTSAVAILTVSNPPPVTVTVLANPADAGTVSGGGSYTSGTNAVLTATASYDWQFVNWNDGTTNNPYAITVPATNITYTANFAAVVTITAHPGPNYAGYVTGGGTFFIGSTDTITAVASNGWIFSQWSDGTTANPYSVIVSTDADYVAIFVPAATVTIMAAPPIGGSTAGDGNYAIGNTATLTATASNGWAFVNWNGVVTNNPWAYVVPSSNTVCTANFAPVSTITTLVNPTNAGSVDGGGVYFVGSNAVLTATASNNWQFVNWNDGTTNNPYTITVPETNVTYTANFGATATVTVSASPDSAGYVIGGGTYLIGTTNPITAVASNGWIFTQWSDGTTANPYNIVVVTNAAYTADFVPAATVTTVAAPPIGGSTTGDGNYAIGTTATLTATASNGWAFVNWNGVITNNPWAYVVPSSNTVCTANFAPASTVTTLVNPTNAGSVDGGGIYFVGSNAVLTATASNNWQFVNWNDGTTNNPYEITVPATNVTYTANFGATATITVSTSPNSAGYGTGGGTYLIGTTNPISAVASNGWIFTQWSDGTTANPYNIVIVTNAAYTADFVPAATVTTVAAPPIGGSTAGDGNYAIGATATLTATASNGWAFVNWNGVITNNPWAYVVPSSNTVCTANFAPVSTITILVNPTNAGSVDGGGVYFVGSNAVLTVTASNNWQFVNWNDGTTNNPYTITVPETNVTYTANFGATATITVSASPNSAGYVTGGGTYLIGSTNPISAVASNGWIFTRWSDGTTANPYNIVVASNATYTADFVPAATITTVASPPTGGSTTGDGTYAIGSPATIAATASNNWYFLNWNGTVTNYLKTGNTNRSLSFTVTSNATYTANFGQVTNLFVFLVMDTVPPQVEIIGYLGPTNQTVYIPTNIDGMPVTVIATGAFGANTYSNVVVPGSITNIQSGAIFADIVELVGATAALVVAGDAFKDLLELDLVDISADVLADLAEDLADDPDMDSLVSVQALATPSDGGSCSGSGFYTKDDEVTLIATPKDGWKFTGWDDGEELPAERVVTADVDKTLTANFARKQATITVEVNNEEAGTAEGGGTLNVGDSMTLTATVNATNGWHFVNWTDEGGAIVSEESEWETTVPDEDTTYTANFQKQVTIKVEADEEEGGMASGGGTFNVGDPMTLTAETTNEDYLFEGWTDEEGDILSLEETFELPAPDEDTTYTAKFVEQVEVEAEADPTNGGSVLGAGTFNANSPVILTAVPNSGWRFNGWFLDGLLTNNPVFITVASPSLEDVITYTAEFVQQVTVTATANPTNGGSVSGGGTYDIESTNIVLTATASSNWQFVNWNDGTTNNPYAIQPPTNNVAYTANFAPAATVTVLANPTNAGIVSGGGVYLAGSNAVLTATASNNWQFVYWNDGATNNPYTITVPATNVTYTANFAAISSVNIDSSANPCGYRDIINFTASIIPTNATGTVQFFTNGVVFDSETLTNGLATSVPTSILPRGTNLITAIYSGDVLDLPATNSMEQGVTNHPPLALPATYKLTTAPSYQILLSNLATNWSDPDGDTVTLLSVNASTNGGAVNIAGNNIDYYDTNSVNDQFTYVISDGQGGEAIGIVNLLSPGKINITGLVQNIDGTFTISFTNTPGYTYWVEAATNLSAPVWTILGTNIAGTNCMWNFTDVNATNYPFRFYRTCQP